MALLLGLVSAGYLLVISLSETKLRWYALPTVPWTAMIFALALRAAWLPRHAGATGGVSKRYGAPPIQRCGASALIAALTLVSLHVAYRVEHRATEQKRTPTHAVDHFLRANGHALPPDEGIAVLQPGVISPHTREPYAAPTLFYVLALRWQGLRIDMIHTERELRPEHRIVVRCRPASTLLDAAQPRRAPLDCHAQRRNALE